MTATLSTPHQVRFEEIKRNLGLLGCKESSFIKVELLFFEALTISRTYGEDMHVNPLLRALKDLQYGPYEKTKEVTRKPAQREIVIKKFIVKLKQVLSPHA
ncbi:MAG: hypothetical protein ACXVMS_18285 [Flavisolibacter sp.]